MRREPDAAPRAAARGRRPCSTGRAAAGASRPLSYSAISAHGERLRVRARSPVTVALREGAGEGLAGGRDGARRAGRAVHALLEWSQANELAARPRRS